MDTEVIALVAAALGVIVSGVFIWLLVRGVRSLSDIKDFLQRPPHDRQ